VQFVRGNIFAGEAFADPEDAHTQAVAWCQGRAGILIHRPTAARPLEVFEAEEAPLRQAAPADYEVPVCGQA
jgi:hypothetical protein